MKIKVGVLGIALDVPSASSLLRNGGRRQTYLNPQALLPSLSPLCHLIQNESKLVPSFRSYP